MLLPAPKLKPPLAAEPGRISRLLAPRLAIAREFIVDTPLPISIIAITAAMPMMMPSVVSTERMMFRRNACSAVRNTL